MPVARDLDLALMPGTSAFVPAPRPRTARRAREIAEARRAQRARAGWVIAAMLLLAVISFAALEIALAPAIFRH